jgi:rod shape-determining protein MreC
VARAVRSGSRADSAILLACAVLALLLTFLPLRLRESIAASLRQTVLAPVIALQAQAERARSAFLTRNETSARIDSLALRLAELEVLAEENARLRKLIGLARPLRWGFIPAEALRGRGLGDEHSVLLTAGSAAGVTSGAGVVAPEGLVGVVATVDPRTSTAILWTHPDFRASATTNDGAVFGIIAPHLGDEADRFLLELGGVPYRDTLAAGTVVRTSGRGGVFPRGIVIGTVLRQLQDAQGWSRTYLVQPAVLPSDITQVMVLDPLRSIEDLSGVWSSPSGVDSATRGVLRAADSLAAASRRDSLARLPAPRDTMLPALMPSEAVVRDTLGGKGGGRGGGGGRR